MLGTKHLKREMVELTTYDIKYLFHQGPRSGNSGLVRVEIVADKPAPAARQLEHFAHASSVFLDHMS